MHQGYHLNTNWLLGESREMLLTPAVKNSKPNELFLLISQIDETRPNYKKYVELIRLMQMESIEQIIFAKLEEMKVIAKKEIQVFLADPGIKDEQ